jgi:hypothetical protein
MVAVIYKAFSGEVDPGSPQKMRQTNEHFPAKWRAGRSKMQAAVGG